ncbi:uncharacterized protein LOC110006897 isoform X2 [Amborella trichopoda]|uniref:uncharacterized protein LOC110006897 isoform X2 n=1 Tax=Amborella trichopoda TaxID=13333 RepID=UPI0009BCFF43|nr:uncharacterized protein LOC110006897 isoform X2 [Amborella trichopoda]|eukprot:XP_020520431.1 uncharacterized protein LOC110006897 isoform X2 [Amborella trichopoda]
MRKRMKLIEMREEMSGNEIVKGGIEKNKKKSKKGKNKGVSIEDYAAFRSDAWANPLTAYQLCKDAVLAAIAAIDLMPLRRSTLQHGASPSDLTEKEVEADVAALNWRECSIKSVVTIRQPLDAPRVNHHGLMVGPSCDTSLVATNFSQSK